MLFLLSACSKEDDPGPTSKGDTIALVVDFIIETDTTVVPVKATITNKTEGADTYEWTLEGTEQATSTEKNPDMLIFDQVGEFTITLTASNASETLTVSKTISVERSNKIVLYENIKLGGTAQHEAIGSFFSTKTGEVFKGKATEENGADIDIAFIGIDGMRFFESPTKVSDWNLPVIPNATFTDFINYAEGSDIDFTVTDFDNMEDDTLIKDLTIEADDSSFGPTTPRVVFFKNKAGQKGLIKVKELVTGSSGYIIFDLKIQKYPM